jgi:hypothetical protein
MQGAADPFRAIYDHYFGAFDGAMSHGARYYHDAIQRANVDEVRAIMREEIAAVNRMVTEEEWHALARLLVVLERERQVAVFDWTRGLCVDFAWGVLDSPVQLFAAWALLAVACGRLGCPRDVDLDELVAPWATFEELEALSKGALSLDGASSAVPLSGRAHRTDRAYERWCLARDANGHFAHVVATTSAESLHATLRQVLADVNSRSFLGASWTDFRIVLSSHAQSAGLHLFTWCTPAPVPDRGHGVSCAWQELSDPKACVVAYAMLMDALRGAVVLPAAHIVVTDDVPVDGTMRPPTRKYRAKR